MPNHWEIPHLFNRPEGKRMNPLVNVLTPKVRAWVYALVSLAALGWGIYQASDGDWKKFVGALIAALVTLTAASNASPTLEDD